MGKEKQNPEKSSQPEDHEDSSEKGRITLREATFTGPIPPSSEFKRYEAILPGAADRILTMAEDERKDRNKNTRLEIWLHYGSRMFAQAMFTFLSLGVVASGVYLITLGENISGLVSIITGLGIISGGFFIAQKNKSKDE